MTNDVASIWNALIRLGRPPANGELLIGNGADFNLAKLTAGSNISIVESAGGIQINSSNPGGTVTGVSAASPLSSSGGNSPTISLTGVVTVPFGGTGQNTLTTNALLLGNGVGAVGQLGPGDDGDILKIVSGAPAWAVGTDWISVFKTSDQSIASNLNLANDTELSFPMAANKTYSIKVYYSVQVGAGGIKISFNGPASPSRIRFGAISGAGTSGAAFQNGIIVASLYDTAIYAFTGGTSVMAFHFEGTITNGSNVGDFVMRVAQASSNSDPTIFEKGSFLQYAEVV